MPAALLNEYPRPIADAFSDLVTPGKKPTQEEVIKLGDMIPAPLIKTCSKQLNHFFSKEMIRVSVKLIPFTSETVKQASAVKDFAVTEWEKHADVPRVLEQRLGLRWAVPQSAVPNDVVLYFSPASTLSTVLTSAAKAPKVSDGLRKEVSFAAGGGGGAASSATPQTTTLSPPVTTTTQSSAAVARTTSNTSTSSARHHPKVPVENDSMISSKRNSTLSIRESETALLAAHSKQSSRRNSNKALPIPPLTKQTNTFKGPVESIKHSVEEMNRLYAERNKVAEEIQQLTMKRAHIELEIATATNRTLVVKESHAAVARETGESYEEAAARAEGILYAKRGEHRRKLEEDQARRRQKEVAVSKMVYLRTALIAMILMFVVGAVTRKFLL